MCKAEIETQTQRTNVWLPRGKGVGWEELGDCVDTYTLLKPEVGLTHASPEVGLLDPMVVLVLIF